MSWKCSHCGYPNPDHLVVCFGCKADRSQPTPAPPPPDPVQPAANTPARPASITLLGTLATLLVVAGIFMVINFMFFFDTSVEAPGSEVLGIPGGRVNNLGLMAERQNGLIFGFGLTFIGLFIGAWDHYTRSR